MISKLASGFVESPNHYNGRSVKVCKFTPHHVAGVMSAEQIANIFVPRARNASANYVIGNDGKIICCVDENNGAWTSSSKWNDNQAITVEVSNSKTGGDWEVSEAAWNSLVNLAVDVCRRYGFRLEYDGTCNGTLTEHRMYIPTACPGNYLHSRMQELAQTVNSILDEETEQSAYKNPTKETEPDYTGPITYQAYARGWLPEVNKCNNTPDGYAGLGGIEIRGFRCKPTYGEIIYQAHVLGIGWCDEVNSKDYSDGSVNSYAGIIDGKGILNPIDAIKIKSTKGYVDYRVKTAKRGWLPWVRQYGDYAGNFGEPIIGIQMK